MIFRAYYQRSILLAMDPRPRQARCIYGGIYSGDTSTTCETPVLGEWVLVPGLLDIIRIRLLISSKEFYDFITLWSQKAEQIQPS